ncbi:MAG TPA: hypothetical protein VLC09_19125, partial [Polyangiaceae bacterium]|nr:hypothetical protein [Polyangiaceae bacterium]
TAFAASLLTGLQFTLGRGWKAGVSLQLPSLFLTGKYTAARSSEGLVVASEQYSQESGTLRAQYPLRAAFGLAGRVPWFSFEANAYVHGASDSLFSVDATRESVTFQGSTVSSHDEGNVTYRERAIPVTNLGLGISAPIHRDWSLLAGVLTDFSGLAPRQPGSADNGIFRSRRDRIHGSLGVAWTPTVGSLLFGVRGFVGDGELAVSSALRSDGSRLILPLDEWGLSLVISGQLNLQMIAKLDPTGLVEGAAGPAKPSPAPPK